MVKDIPTLLIIFYPLEGEIINQAHVFNAEIHLLKIKNDLLLLLLKLLDVRDAVENKNFYIHSYQNGGQKEKPKSNWTDDDKKRPNTNCKL